MCHIVSDDAGFPVLGGVGRDDDAGPLVGLANHVEQQFRPQLVCRNVPQFVEDQHVETSETVPSSNPVVPSDVMDDGNVPFFASVDTAVTRCGKIDSATHSGYSFASR